MELAKAKHRRDRLNEVVVVEIWIEIEWMMRREELCVCERSRRKSTPSKDRWEKERRRR